MKYEELPESIRLNLDRGHELAMHHIDQRPGVEAQSHLTTVQKSVESSNGRVTYYCTNICEDFTEPGSVVILPVEKEAPPTVGSSPAADRHATEFTITKAMEELGLKAERLDALYAWMVERHTLAVVQRNTDKELSHAGTLFYIETGKYAFSEPDEFYKYAERIRKDSQEKRAAKRRLLLDAGYIQEQTTEGDGVKYDKFPEASRGKSLSDLKLKKPLPDERAEAEAKAAWEALDPAEDTIEWYDKFFADIQDIGTAKSNPRYYRTLMEHIAEYRKEREEFGDDDGWLSGLRDQYHESSGCEGHESLDGAHMGETVHCDGTCR